MKRRRQRLYAIALVLLGMGAATGLTLFSLRDNVTFFTAPRPFMKRRFFTIGALARSGWAGL